MKNKFLTLLALLVTFAMPCAVAQEQTSQREGGHAPCQMMAQSVNFQSVKISYSPLMDAIVAIDSMECAVHLVGMRGEDLDTLSSYMTDQTYKRHDLKNILRPVSVGFIGPYVVVVASAQNDSAYVALLDINMRPVARRDFSCRLFAFHFEHGNLMLAGLNTYGYDIHVLPMHGGLEAFANAEPLSQSYRVAKQSEKIAKVDPVGIGLSTVAVAVVFLALVCITIILLLNGKVMKKVVEKDSQEKAAPHKTSTASSSSDEGEVMAAIAAAIQLYNDELHDEESSVITIQGVEREWTPWNAKYYNMNHYFSNKR